MLAAARHTRAICAAESLARATFTDLFPSGDDWTSQVASLQKEFRAFIRLEACRFEALKTDLNNWRERVTCGDIEFDPAREDDFKGALRALIVFEDCLLEKFDAYSAKGLYLAKTRFIGFMLSHRQVAETILDSWKSPEWETTDERTVKWDKEQTEYLRRKLASCV